MHPDRSQKSRKETNVASPIWPDIQLLLQKVEHKGLGFDGRIFYISNMDGETATIIFGVTIDPRDETRKVLIAKDDALSRLGIAAAEAQKICQKFGSY